MIRPTPPVPPAEPRRRPPWWPEDEAWPPERWGLPWWRADGSGSDWSRAGWRVGRRSRHGGLARAFGCFVVVLAVLAVSIGLLVVWLIAAILGFVHNEGLFPGFASGAGALVLVVGVAVLVGGIRLARRIGPTLGDLVDAAGRVEAGDYAVRVPEARRGPPELRHLGRAFNTMTARLEADAAQRRRLLADVSHELRTPLAVVQGNLEAVIDGVYPADEAHLTPILEETRVIERLIEDLRTLSLAEAGTLGLHPEPTDIGVLVADAIEAFRVRADAAGVELTVDVATDLPLVELDPIRIREVISNLVDNALRFVASGGAIRVSAGQLGPGRGAGEPLAARLEIAVRDDGPGIPPELLPTVFDRFAKGAGSRGSGLGLAIAKAIVEAHGGSIAAAAPPAGGTTITFILPLP